MTKEQKYALLLAIGHAERQAEAFYDTIAEAALLAVNQVQDQRIAVLEEGPTVNTTDLLFDLFLAVALDGPVLGSVIQQAIKIGANRFLSTRNAFFNLGAKTEFGEKAFKAVLNAGGMGLVARSATKKMERAAEDLLQINGPAKIYAQEIFDGFENGGMILHSSIKEGVKGIKRAPKDLLMPLSSCDSAGTSVLDSALSMTAKQKMDARRVLDGIRLLVLLDDFPQNEYQNMLVSLAQHSRELGNGVRLSDIKRALAEYFELAIWVGLYPTDLNVTQRTATLVLSHDAAKDKLLTIYMLKRFHAPPEFTDTYYDRARGTDDDALAGPVEALRKYLKVIRKQLADMAAKRPGDVGGLNMQ